MYRLLLIVHRARIYIQELHSECWELGAWSKREIRDDTSDSNCRYP